MANIDEEFTSEPAAETLQEDSALLRAHRDNEAFDNFDFVHDKIADNIRATAMLDGTGVMGAGQSSSGSFMEFDGSGPRFGITEIDPKTAQQQAYQQKNSQQQIFREGEDQAVQPRKEATQSTSASEDKYDF